MLETRIKITGTLEQDLRTFLQLQYGDTERGSVNFIIKQALRKFLNGDESFNRQQELEKEKKRDEKLNLLPQVMGEAIAKALIRETSGKSFPGYHIEAIKGESGEIGCPKCGKPISIEPEAVNSICPNCGEEIPIKRIKK